MKKFRVDRRDKQFKSDLQQIIGSLITAVHYGIQAPTFAVGNATFHCTNAALALKKMRAVKLMTDRTAGKYSSFRSTKPTNQY